MIDLRRYRANTARRFGSANHYHVGWVIGEVKQVAHASPRLADDPADVLLSGAPDETLSSRAHRMRVKGQPVWGWTADVIDWLALPWQDDHCEIAYQREWQRRQLPGVFR